MSDVLPEDFDKTLDALADPAFFRKEDGDRVTDAEHEAALAMCLSRWRESFPPANLRIQTEHDCVKQGRT